MVQRIKLLKQYIPFMKRITGINLQLRYHGTVFGFFWTMLNAFAMITIFTFVFGYSDIKVYLNLELIETFSYSFMPLAQTNTAKIGSSTQTGFQISYVNTLATLIYSKALSLSEINKNYNYFKPRI